MHDFMAGAMAQLRNEISPGVRKQGLEPTCALTRRTDAKSEGYPTLLKTEISGDRSNIQGIAPMKEHERRAQRELQAILAQRKSHPRAEKTGMRLKKGN